MKTKPRSLQDKYSHPYTLKPTEFPPNFALVVDTREQRPLFPRIPKGLTICSAMLKNGDYSVLGFENLICFERKGISDLFPYCSTEREKTLAKMKRFATMEFVALVIESRESDVYQHQQFTKVHPEVIRGALTSFQIRYGVHVYMGSREQCARYILDCATKFWKVKHSI